MTLELTPIGTPIHRLNQLARRQCRDSGIPLHKALDNVAFWELKKIDQKIGTEFTSKRARTSGEKQQVRPDDSWALLKYISWDFDFKNRKLSKPPRDLNRKTLHVGIEMLWEEGQIPSFAHNGDALNRGIATANTNISRTGPGNYIIECLIGRACGNEIYADRNAIKLLGSPDEKIRASGWIGLEDRLYQKCKDTAKTQEVDSRAALELQAAHLHALPHSELLFELGSKDGLDGFFAAFLTDHTPNDEPSIDLLYYREGPFHGFKILKRAPEHWNSLVAGFSGTWSSYKSTKVRGLTLNVPQAAEGFRAVAEALFSRIDGDLHYWFYEEAPWLMSRKSSDYQRISDITDGLVNGSSVLNQK